MGVEVDVRGDADVGRQQDLLASGLGGLEVLLAGLDGVIVDQRLANLQALGLEEGEQHAATDDKGVGNLEQVVDHGKLVGDLGTTEDDDERTLRVGGQALEDLDLLGDQGAGSALDQSDLAVGEGLGGLGGGRADDVLSELDVKVHELAQTLGNRGQRVLGVDGTLGTTEVGEHSGARAGLVQLGQGGQGGLDAAVIGDLVPVERDVEVATDDDALAAQVSEILNRFHVEALS